MADRCQSSFRSGYFITTVVSYVCYRLCREVVGEHEDWCRLELEEEKKTTRNVEHKFKKKTKTIHNKQSNKQTGTQQQRN